MRVLLVPSRSTRSFSVSLAVDDMEASRAFYSTLGFDMVAGDGEGRTIVSDGSAVIGLFHGMFEGNILTFNPGWQGLGQPADEYADIRQLRDLFLAAGIDVINDTTGDSPAGPGSFSITDRDGNAILIGQHF